MSEARTAVVSLTSLLEFRKMLKIVIQGTGWLAQVSLTSFFIGKGILCKDKGTGAQNFRGHKSAIEYSLCTTESFEILNGEDNIINKYINYTKELFLPIYEHLFTCCIKHYPQLYVGGYSSTYLQKLRRFETRTKP